MTPGVANLKQAVMAAKTLGKAKAMLQAKAKSRAQSQRKKNKQTLCTCGADTKKMLLKKELKQQ